MRIRTIFWGLGLFGLNFAAFVCTFNVLNNMYLSRPSTPQVWAGCSAASLILSLFTFVGVIIPLSKARQDSEQSCLEILDASADGLFVLGTGNIIEFVNAGACRLLGFTSQDLVGKCAELFIKEVTDGTKRHLITSSELDVLGLSYNVVATRGDGVSVPMNLAVSETKSRGKKKRVWVIRDLTDVRRMQLELEQSEDRFKALAESSPIGVFQVDTYGSLLYANAHFTALLGHRKQELVGGGWIDWIHPDFRDNLLASLKRATETETGFTMEIRLWLFGGLEKWARIGLSPLRRQDSSLLGFVGSLEDVTEIKQTQERLIEAQALVHQALESLTVGFVMYDTSERLVFANSAYKAHYPLIADVMRPGMPYENILREHLARDGRNPFGKPEAFIAHWRRMLLRTDEPWEQILEGRRVQTNTVRTAEGNFVSILTDIGDLREAQKVAEAAHQHLEEAFETLDAGFVMYDQDDRLLICNSRFQDMYPEAAPFMKPGAMQRDIILAQLKTGEEEEAFIDTFLRLHRNGPSEHDHNGRRIMVSNSRTASGCLVSLRSDISELAAAKAAAVEASDYLLEAFQSINAGFAIYDSDDRLIYCNPQLKQMYPMVADALNPGTSFEDIMRTQFKNLRLNRLGVDENEWVRQRLVERANSLTLDDLLGSKSPIVSKSHTASGNKIVIHFDPDRKSLAA
ncbi:MAG: PAS-domain containing protein [Fimbriimonadaceae bacterium]